MGNFNLQYMLALASLQSDKHEIQRKKFSCYGLALFSFLQNFTTFWKVKAIG